MKRFLLISISIGAALTLNLKPGLAQGEAWIKKSPNSTHLTNVKTTPFGILAGELDSRVWLNPFNGVYITNDFGDTWTESGLEGRGITDIAYNNGKMFVTTKFVIDNEIGLFTSSDGGNTWEHNSTVGFGTLSVDSTDKTILLGGASRGLWISFDNGVTWQQKIGDGLFGPDVYKVVADQNLFLATTDNRAYKSTDGGVVWDEIVFLESKQIKYFEIKNNVVLAGSPNSGLYRSTDFGQTWNELTSWEGSAAGTIEHFQNNFYAGKQIEPNKYSVFKSDDNGVSWQDTSLSSVGNILDLTWTFSEPSYLFAATLYDGIHRYQIDNNVFESNQFLDTPWNTQDDGELIDKIFSVFDHSYPLQGYDYHTEPPEEINTTVDYLGNRSEQPDLYYSSHDGFDFTLPYGTTIIAPNSGFATYYYCKDCGHSIKIDHQNGYQSTYFHLQGDGLITTNDIPVRVDVGDQIGKVGMTGNTTGPHLHFSIIKDLNMNGTFIDDFPDGKVDPFGWQNNDFSDPWEVYSWVDTLGNHLGTQSAYLWNFLPSNFASNIGSDGGEINFNNKKVVIQPNSFEQNVTLILKNFITPFVYSSQQNLKYISGTSIIISVLNYLNEKTPNLNSAATIEFNFSSANLQNVLENTIKIYTFNPTNKLWEPINTVVLDLIDKKILGETTHFSQFAVFGEKIDNEPPTTIINISGGTDDEWFVEYPTVTISSDDGVDGSGVGKMFYKIADEIDWNEYSTPFILQREGVFGIEFKSIDVVGNLENSKDVLVRIDTNNKWKGSAKVLNNTFSID